MIILIAFVVLAVVSLVTGYAWQTVWGFYALERASWAWAWDFTCAYGHPPWFVVIGAYGGLICALVMILTIRMFASRVRTKSLHGNQSANTLHGSAHWATKEDAKDANLFQPQGVVVGGWPGYFGIETLRHDGPEHVLIFAPTRSGKGVASVVPTLLTWPASTLVLDIKGENWRLTSGWRASQGQRILKFDPASESGSARFNPLAEVRMGTNHEIADVQNIGTMLIDPEGKGLKDFWMKTGFAWLSASLLHVLYKVQKGQNRIATLRDVSLALAMPDVKDFDAMLTSMIGFDHGRESVNEFVHASAKEMLAAAHPERSGVHSSAKTELMLYRDPIVARNIAESDFKLDDLMQGDKAMSLYLVVPPSDIDRLQPLIRVMMNLFLRRQLKNLGADGKAIYKHRLLLMLDEFTSIGKLEIFERSLGFMGGYGLKAVLIVQTLTQLQNTYGRENSIMGHCHIRVAYAPNELATAEILSKMSGASTQVSERRDRSHKAMDIFSGNVTDRMQEVGRPLLTPDECMRLRPAKKSRRDPEKIVKAGEMLTFAGGYPPIRGMQPLFFKDKELLRRSKVAPVVELTERDCAAPISASVNDAEETAVAVPAASGFADRIRQAAQFNPPEEI
ncbi:MAG: type IV secretory system conjugative DNA transfer family protein [Rhodospirillaceae bacterium]|nr:type IV secretory system conjugative DNA transfer family protein [Rhodospirillaceae bacterium]